jgi:hypothetical protein
MQQDAPQKNKIKNYVHAALKNILHLNYIEPWNLEPLYINTHTGRLSVLQLHPHKSARGKR